MSQVIDRQGLLQLVAAWLGQGKRVFGPSRIKRDLVQYQPLPAADALLLDGFIRPANSIKECFLPRHETLFAYRRNGKKIELVETPVEAPETIILAARPCDAAATEILDHVFRQGIGRQGDKETRRQGDKESPNEVDPFYEARRQAATVVTLACRSHDDHCFCTSVGLAPDSPRGADAMLLDLGDGTFEVRCFTPKGEALWAASQTEQYKETGRQGDKETGRQGDKETGRQGDKENSLYLRSSDKVYEAPAGPEKVIDLDAIHALLANHFDSPDWQLLGLRCLGCGTCAFSCPTCHCFDIVDEGHVREGVRVRNWDTCQFGMYTQHASGHNPRSVQPQRQRNRIYHKFKNYRDRFGDWLCTGCGNCTRHCPVSLGVRPVLESLQKQARSEGGAA